MHGCAPGFADSNTTFPGLRAPLPACFYAFTAEAAVEVLPYRNTKVSLLVVSGCCHVATPAVIQVCCEPRTKRRTPFFWVEVER